MKTVYYEVLEFDGDFLNNIFYYAHSYILDSKYHAERYYCQKVKQAQSGNSLFNYKLVLAIVEDFQTTRHILNDTEARTHELESMLLSGLTGKQIEIPEWPHREAWILENYV